MGPGASAPGLSFGRMTPFDLVAELLQAGEQPELHRLQVVRLIYVPQVDVHAPAVLVTVEQELKGIPVPYDRRPRKPGDVR